MGFECFHQQVTEESCPRMIQRKDQPVNPRTRSIELNLVLRCPCISLRLTAFYISAERASLQSQPPQDRECLLGIGAMVGSMLALLILSRHPAQLRLPIYEKNYPRLSCRSVLSISISPPRVNRGDSPIRGLCLLCDRLWSVIVPAIW